MKKIIFLFLVLLALTSCNQEKSKKMHLSKDSLENNENTVSSKKNEAIKILNEVDMWVKKGVTNKISKEEVNKQIGPLMKKYNELLQEMNRKDSITVQKYRIDQVNKMINLQMNQK